MEGPLSFLATGRPPQHMRACFISHQYPPAAGGIGRFTADLAAGFANAGHETHVISCGPYEAESHEMEHGVRVHRIAEAWPSPSALQSEVAGADLARLATVYRELKRLHDVLPFDIISAPIWLGEGLLTSLDPNLPSVLSLHTETRTLTQIDEFWRSHPRSPGLMALEQRAVSVARHTHANSAACLAKISADYGAPQGAFVIHHGVPDLSQRVTQDAVSGNRVRVLVVGWLDVRKGADLLVEVLPRLLELHAELEVALVGQAVAIAEIGGLTVEEVIAGRCSGRPGLTDRIHFLGRVSDDELRRQYAQADILLFPTRHESFGLPLIEAMSFGVPSVASRAGAVPEIVAHGEQGLLVQVGDSAGLVAAVSTLVDDPERRYRMGWAARKRYVSEFSLAVSVPRTIAAYRAAAAKERERTRRVQEFCPVAALGAIIESTTALRDRNAHRAAAELLGEEGPAASIERPRSQSKRWMQRVAQLRFRTFRSKAPKPSKSTAIVWLTHVENRDTHVAFQRLRREASSYGDVFCACHGDAVLSGLGARPIRLDDADLLAALPSRGRAWIAGGSDLYGFIDVLHFAVARRLPGFDHYWFLEYDVDFSGRWETLFSAFVDCRADLVGTTLLPRSADPDWTFWPDFAAPEGVSAQQHFRGFFPVTRISRRFMQAYAANVDRGWSGHFEALYPSLAAATGQVVEDIGGDGPLTPADRRGRFYSNTGGHPWLLPGSFRFRPAVAARYYVPGAAEFPEPDFLWHPVKPAPPLPARR